MARKQIQSANYLLTKVQGKDEFIIVEKINQKSICGFIFKSKKDPNKWTLKIDYFMLAKYEQNEWEDREREIYELFDEFNKN